MSRLVGNAIVGQSGGPTAAINATLAGVIRGAKECSEIGTLYGAFNGIEGILEGRFCDLFEIFRSEKDITSLEHTPAAALGSCRKKLPAPDATDEASIGIYEKIFAFFRAHDIRYFFYIGGNDSMDTVAKLYKYARKNNYDIRVMGVPKTIDNDLEGTDHTPGYGSAAKYIAASMQEMLRDCAVYTVKAVTIVEIMGRDAGWLTAASAISSVGGVAPDLVYLPERIFDLDKFFDDVKRALEIHPNVVVAVSEGLRFSDGSYVGESSQSGAVDVFGHKYLSGTGKTLEMAIKNKLGCKVRSVELNIVQRCASHIASKCDITESVRIGRFAVTSAVEGNSGKIPVFVRRSSDPYECEIELAEIADIANKIKTVPDNFINGDGNGVTDDFARYLLPLIRGEVMPEYRDGLPVHFEIKR